VWCVCVCLCVCEEERVCGWPSKLERFVHYTHQVFPSISLTPFCSLSLSLTLSHTHTLSHYLSHSLMDTLSISLCLSRDHLQVIAATRFFRIFRLSVVKENSSQEGYGFEWKRNLQCYKHVSFLQMQKEVWYFHLKFDAGVVPKMWCWHIRALFR
jgi:hypothetical protein